MATSVGSSMFPLVPELYGADLASVSSVVGDGVGSDVAVDISVNGRIDLVTGGSKGSGRGIAEMPRRRHHRGDHRQARIAFSANGGTDWPSRAISSLAMS